MAGPDTPHDNRARQGMVDTAPAQEGPGLRAVETTSSARVSMRSRASAHLATWWPVWVAYLASRMGIVAAGLLSQYAAGQRGLEAVGFPTAGTYPHYADVAANGYTAANAFEFPLLPALMWLGAQAGLPLAVAGMLVVNAAFLAGIIAFAMLGERYVGRDAAIRGAIYLAIFPTAYAFTLVSTESILLLGLAGSALAATRGRWGLAIVLALIAGLTRPPAVFVAIAIGGIVWAARSGRLPGIRQIAAIAAAPAAVTAFFTYLWFVLGDFFAAVHAQEQFDRSLSLTGPFAAIWSAIADLRSGILGPFAELLALIGIVALVTYFVRRADGPRWELRGWTLYAAASLLLPLATGLVWQMPRFALLIPPVFWALGMLGQRRWLHQALLVLLPMALTFRVVFEVVGVAR